MHLGLCYVRECAYVYVHVCKCVCMCVHYVYVWVHKCVCVCIRASVPGCLKVSDGPVSFYVKYLNKQAARAEHLPKEGFAQDKVNELRRRRGFRDHHAAY